MRRALALLLLLQACQSPKGTPSPTPSAVVSAAPLASGVASAPPEPRYIASFAEFGPSSVLEACTDRDFTSRIKANGFPDGESWANLRAKMRAVLLGDGGPSVPRGGSIVPIEDACETAFADRTVFARCALDELTTVYFSLDALENDIELRDCLKQGGKWWGIDRSSVEYLQAKTEHDIAKASRLTGRP